MSQHDSISSEHVKASHRIFGIGAIDAIGLGIYLSVQALFLSRGIGLGDFQTGIVLGVSGIASLLGAMPIAHGVQRIGLKKGLCLLLVARSAAFMLLSFVNSFEFALLAISLTGATSRSTVPLVEAALIGERGREASMFLLGRLRIIRTSGIAAGGLPVGLSIWLDTPEAYRMLMVGSSLFYITGAILCVSKHLAGTVPSQQVESTFKILTDKAFVMLIVVYGNLTLATIVLGIGLPLWVVQNSAAPGWIVGAFKVVNTICVILWQSHANKGTHILSGAYKRLRFGGILVASASALIMAVGVAGTYSDVLLILAVVIIFSFGEVYIAAGGQGAALCYIPDGQRPVYMSAFNLGFAGATVVGPVLSALSVTGPPYIWLFWGCGFFLVTVFSKNIPSPTVK